MFVKKVAIGLIHVQHRLFVKENALCAFLCMYRGVCVCMCMVSVKVMTHLGHDTLLCVCLCACACVCG